jgi:hypothetical protein
MPKGKKTVDKSRSLKEVRRCGKARRELYKMQKGPAKKSPTKKANRVFKSKEAVAIITVISRTVSSVNESIQAAFEALGDRGGDFDFDAMMTTLASNFADACREGYRLTEHYVYPPSEKKD